MKQLLRIATKAEEIRMKPVIRYGYGNMEGNFNLYMCVVLLASVTLILVNFWYSLKR